MKMMNINFSSKSHDSTIKNTASLAIRRHLRWIVALLVVLAYPVSNGFAPAAQAQGNGAKEATGKDSNPMADKGLLYRLKRGQVRRFSFHDKPRAVPKTTMSDGKGGVQTPQDWKGRTILLNFWAPWCDACRRELPSLERLDKQLDKHKFDVVVVNVDKDVGKAVAMLKEMDIKRLITLDDPGQKALKSIAVIGIPTSVLIDCHGRELGRLKGAAHWDGDSAVLMVRAMMQRTGCSK